MTTHFLYDSPTSNVISYSFFLLLFIAIWLLSTCNPIYNSFVICFPNQNQQSSDPNQGPDRDGLSDARIHKDANDEDRYLAVSYIFLFSHWSIFSNRMKCPFAMFFTMSLCVFHICSNSHRMNLQFMTHSVCNQEKTNETEEEALQNKGVDVRAPPGCIQPPECCNLGHI